MQGIKYPIWHQLAVDNSLHVVELTLPDICVKCPVSFIVPESLIVLHFLARRVTLVQL